MLSKQPRVDVETYETLKALEFCTGKKSHVLLSEALALMLAADPDLAQRVDVARKVRSAA